MVAVLAVTVSFACGDDKKDSDSGSGTGSGTGTATGTGTGTATGTGTGGKLAKYTAVKCAVPPTLPMMFADEGFTFDKVEGKTAEFVVHFSQSYPNAKNPKCVDPKDPKAAPSIMNKECFHNHSDAEKKQCAHTSKGKLTFNDDGTMLYEAVCQTPPCNSGMLYRTSLTGTAAAPVKAEKAGCTLGNGTAKIDKGYAGTYVGHYTKGKTKTLGLNIVITETGGQYGLSCAAAAGTGTGTATGTGTGTATGTGTGTGTGTATGTGT